MHRLDTKVRNIKVYLFVYESVNEDDGGSCEQKAFTSKEIALQIFKDEVASFKEEIKNGNCCYDTCDEDDTSAAFYNEGYYNAEHVLLAVREIDLQDDVHELNSMENFVRSEIEERLNYYGEDVKEKSALVDSLTNDVMEDDTIWGDFYSSLHDICYENEEYKEIYEEYHM